MVRRDRDRLRGESDKVVMETDKVVMETDKVVMESDRDRVLVENIMVVLSLTGQSDSYIVVAVTDHFLLMSHCHHCHHCPCIKSSIRGLNNTSGLSENDSK